MHPPYSTSHSVLRLMHCSSSKPLTFAKTTTRHVSAPWSTFSRAYAQPLTSSCIPTALTAMCRKPARPAVRRLWPRSSSASWPTSRNNHLSMHVYLLQLSGTSANVQYAICTAFTIPPTTAQSVLAEHTHSARTSLISTTHFVRVNIHISLSSTHAISPTTHGVSLSISPPPPPPKKKVKKKRGKNSTFSSNSTFIFSF